MKLLVFKLGLIVVGLLIARFYLTKTRSAVRDRLIVLTLVVGLLVAVIDPQTTTWVANRVGIGRGADLVFYLGFLFLLFLAGAQRVRLREQQKAIVGIVRELALLRARTPPE